MERMKSFFNKFFSFFIAIKILRSFSKLPYFIWIKTDLKAFTIRSVECFAYNMIQVSVINNLDVSISFRNLSKIYEFRGKGLSIAPLDVRLVTFCKFVTMNRMKTVPQTLSICCCFYLGFNY